MNHFMCCLVFFPKQPCSKRIPKTIFQPELLFFFEETHSWLSWLVSPFEKHLGAIFPSSQNPGAGTILIRRLADVVDLGLSAITGTAANQDGPSDLELGQLKGRKNMWLIWNITYNKIVQNS